MVIYLSVVVVGCGEVNCELKCRWKGSGPCAQIGTCTHSEGGKIVVSISGVTRGEDGKGWNAPGDTLQGVTPE